MKIGLTPLGLAAGLVTQLAFAGPEIEEGAGALQLAAAPAERIEVTGRRHGGGEASAAATGLALTVRETPQALTVVPRDLIDDFGLHSAQRLLEVAGGVNVERVETDRTYFSVRGFEVSNFLVDGTGLPFATGDQQGEIDTALYERVEVLFGANGLMSATGNPSATVNFVRKRPTAQRQASAALTLGSWRQRRFDADVAGPLDAEGRVRGRLVLAAESRDSYLDRYHLDKQVAGGVLEWDLSPRTRLSLGHSLQRTRPDSPMWGALPLAYTDGSRTDYPASASTAADWAYWDNDDTQTFGELRHRFGNRWQLTATLMRRVLGSDAALLYVYGAPDRSTGEGLASWPSRYSHVERQGLADLRASGPFTLGGREHELVLGASAARSSVHMRSSADDIGLPVPEPAGWDGRFPQPGFDQGITGSGDFVDHRRSLYAAARWRLADTLSALTGVNLAQAQSDGLSYGSPHHYRKTRASPYLGAVLDLDARHSLYASVADIFRPQTEIDAQGAVLPPVLGRNAELGLKGEWLERRLQGSAAVFRTRQRNLAEQADFVDGVQRYTTVDATATGLQLDASGQVAPGLQVSAGYTQLQLEDRGGEDVRTYVPRRLLNLSTRWQVPAWPQLKLGAALKWQSEIRRDSIRQPAYAMLDLMAALELGQHLLAQLNLQNVTDRKVLASLYWSQSYYAAPRNGSVTLRWQY